LQRNIKKEFDPNLKIILGVELLDDMSKELGRRKFNALIEIDSSGLTGMYFKSKYIPFQEAVPKGFEFLGFKSENYSIVNSSNKEFENKKANFIPLLAICYESIYGTHLKHQSMDAASAIFMFSNEAFLNQSKGKEQYLDFVRARAIEFRKEIARASNGGYAVVIDQYGFIKKISPSTGFHIINSLIKTNNHKTFYSMYGDYIGVISCFIVSLIFIRLCMHYVL
jgi:apolipoprotein N-acyltransferase